MLSRVQSFVKGFLRGMGLNRSESINNVGDFKNKISNSNKWKCNPALQEIYSETKNLLDSLLKEKNGRNMHTFPKVSLDRIHSLLKLLDQVNLETLNISQPIHNHLYPSLPSHQGSVDNLPWKYGDIAYIDLYSEKDFTITAFVLPPHTAIPLHDHPYMAVLSRVLYGSVHVKTFDYIRNNKEMKNIVECKRDETLEKEMTTYLLEDKENLHTFRAGENGTAILDIIVPQYNVEEGRICTYYDLKPSQDDKDLKTELSSSIAKEFLSESKSEAFALDNSVGKLYELIPIDEYNDSSFDFTVSGADYIGPLVSKD